MAETEDKKAPKTKEDVFDELDYIMYPEPEPVTGGAYDYF